MTRPLPILPKVIELRPKDAEAWFNRGPPHYRLGQYNKTITDLTRAIELGLSRSELVRAHVLRAAAYSRLARFELSRKDYQAALTQAPDNAGVHNELAWFLANCPEVKLRNPEQAVKAAKEAVHLAPNSGGYWNTLGVAHYRAGDWKAALTALDRSLELRPGDAFDFFFLAMVHRKLGHRNEARMHYDQALQLLEKDKAAMEKNRPLLEDLHRFRREAEDILELKKSIDLKKRR